MRLQDFKVLSFDCYGTLVDWESGIWNALQPLLQHAGTPVTRERALATYAEIEPVIEHEHPALLYRGILARVHHAMSERWNLSTTAELDHAFGGSIGEWPVFPDTVQALAYLKQHARLVILSNVDRKSFAATNVKLGVTFDAICTAEDIGSYKPDPKNFEFLLQAAQRLGCDRQDLLHVAQSLFHDIAPAERLGLARCWINRRGDKGKGSGATGSVGRMPAFNFTYPSLGAFASAHRDGQ